MNSKYLKLCAYQAKALFNPKKALHDMTHSKKSLLKGVGILFLILCLAPSYAAYIYLANGAYDMLSMLNQQRAILSFGVMMNAALTLFFGLSYVFATLFNSEDTSMLLTLPIKPKNIIASKLTVILIFELLISTMILLPLFISYGINSGAGAMFYVYAVIIILLSAVIPLAVSTVISVVTVRAFGMRINTELVQVILMLALTACILAFNFSTAGQALNMNEAELIHAIITDGAFLSEKITSIYFPALLATEALLAPLSVKGFMYLCAYAAVSIACFAVGVFVGDKLYLQAVCQGLGAKVKSKKLSDEQLKKSSGGNSRAVSIMKNDMRILFRTPIFVFNTVFIIPLMIVIFGIGFMAENVEGMEIVGSLYDMFGDYFLFVYSAIMMFMLSSASITASSFSREGTAHHIYKSLPVTGKDQLIGRLSGQIIINFVTLCIMAVLLVVFMNVEILPMAVTSISIFSCLIPVNILGLILDGRKPLIDWDNPARAVKQNMNVLFSMLGGMAYTVIIGFTVWQLYMNFNFTFTISMLAATGISLILGIILAKVFIGLYPKMIMEN